MLIKDIIQELEKFAPLHLQESYDNAGLIIGDSSLTCSGIICTLDATEAVIEEAIAAGCNLVVAHHPIVFSGLKTITGKNYVEQTVIHAIKNDIAIYAIHTNLDNSLKGVNDRMADKIGLLNRAILAPKTNYFIQTSELNADYQEVGSGLMGNLPEPMDQGLFLQMLQTSFNLQMIRHSPFLGKPIQKLAICGGAGSFLISKAIAAGADAFVTSDLKYHEFFDAIAALLLADIGHWESEQYTTELLIDILKLKFPTFAVLKSVIKTNPVNYYL
jgi:dinuclear metal center YbgI/SA1388 family protein